jgi:hypothetical protein
MDNMFVAQEAFRVCGKNQKRELSGLVRWLAEAHENLVDEPIALKQPTPGGEGFLLRPEPERPIIRRAGYGREPESPSDCQALHVCWQGKD